MYEVGTVSVPVALKILGLENVAIQLPDTCERVIVCFMVGFPFWLSTLGGSLLAGAV